MLPVSNFYCLLLSLCLVVDYYCTKGLSLKGCIIVQLAKCETYINGEMAQKEFFLPIFGSQATSQVLDNTIQYKINYSVIVCTIPVVTEKLT